MHPSPFFVSMCTIEDQPMLIPWHTVGSGDQVSEVANEMEFTNFAAYV